MAEAGSPGSLALLARVRGHLLHRVWLAGYSSYRPPDWLCWMMAGSDWHRAWLLGHLGFFVEDGVAYGPAKPYPSPREFPNLD